MATRVINPAPEAATLPPNSLSTELSYATLLDVYDRILPDNYLSTLKQPGPGYEFLESVASMMHRVSVAVQREGEGQYIGLAPDGSVATGTVTFYRTGTFAGAYTIETGTVVSTPEGFCFRTTADVHMAAGATSVTADIESSDSSGIAMRGYLWNIDGPYTRTNTGEVIEQGISVIVTPKLIPDADPATYTFDPYLRVRQPTDSSTTGGTDPMLSALGLDRGIERDQYSDAASYRTAVEQLPDVVSPQAILRTMRHLMQVSPLTAGLPYDVIEQWESGYQTCYDAPVNTTLADPNFTVSQLPQQFSSNVFVYDDPRGAYITNPDAVNLPYHIANRYLDGMPAIIVSVPDLGTEALNTGTYTPMARALAIIKPAGVELQFILQGQ